MRNSFYEDQEPESYGFTLRKVETHGSPHDDYSRPVRQAPRTTKHSNMPSFGMARGQQSFGPTIEARVEAKPSKKRSQARSQGKKKRENPRKEKPQVQEEEATDFTEIFSWGNDSQGQLGLGPRHSKGYKSRHSLPRYCSFNVIVIQMACGMDHSVFFTGKS